MNFLDALNTKVSDIEKPARLPVGTYVWAVNKPHKESTSKDGAWSTVEVPCVPKFPYDDAEDVNADELSAFGDLKQGSNSIRFMFPNDPDKENERKQTLYNLRRFLIDTLQVEGDDDSTVKELLAKAVGMEFVAQAAHRHVPERDETYVDVKNWAPMA